MIKLEERDPSLAAALAALPADGVDVFTLADGTVRGFLLRGTRLVAAMRSAFGPGPLETVALGQAYLAAGLLSATLKGEDRMAIRMDCAGALGGFSVEADATGSVRGRLLAKDSLPPSPESLDLAPFIGEGTLCVSRFSGSTPVPFTGQIKLARSRIAEDLAEYYLRSEQTPTAFALSVAFGADGSVSGAGGLLLQALPGAEEAGDLGSLETIFAFLPGIGEWFAGGGEAEAFIKTYFGMFGPELLGRKRAAFDCPCSAERFAVMASSLPEAPSFLESGPWPMELVCHNCGSAYLVQRDDFERRVERKRRLREAGIDVPGLAGNPGKRNDQ